MPRAKRLYFQLNDRHKEVVDIIAKLYIQRDEARGKKVENHHKFDLYNHLANYYSDEELDTKYQELYKNRKDFTSKEKNKIFSEKMKHYNPISYR